MSLVRLPTLLGIEPEKLFWLMSKCSRLKKFTISSGMGPSKLLRDNDSIFMFCKFTFAVG